MTEAVKLRIQEQAAYFRQHLPFSVVFKHYGLFWKSDATHQFSCPFHGEDKNPSARYYADTRRMHCFGCGEDPGGDIIWFLKKKENFQSWEAVTTFIQKIFGVSPNNVSLAGKIALQESMKAEPPRIEFVRRYKDRMNDLLYRLKQDPRTSKMDYEGVSRIIWDNFRALTEGPQPPYLEFCASVRMWFDDSFDLLKTLVATIQAKKGTTDGK